MTMLFYAWKASGADPYKTYNGLDETYRPIGQPEASPRPPRFPERVRAVIYAFAMYARELERKDRVEQAQMTAAASRGQRIR